MTAPTYLDPDAAIDARVRDLLGRMQDLALDTRLQIPITLSTDPRHAFAHNPGTSAAAGDFSAWPEAIGLAAIGDADLVEEFASIARQKYTAVGLRVALHPQIDLATEPRWCRIVGTFGEDRRPGVRPRHHLPVPHRRVDRAVTGPARARCGGGTRRAVTELPALGSARAGHSASQRSPSQVLGW